MSSNLIKRKPRKLSLVEVTNKYCNNEEACYDFFFKIKYPDGYYCEKCGCTHGYKVIRHHVMECSECGHQEYLFAGTIFQSNKLPLYTLILGLYLFFSSNKGISGIEMSNQLDVNYKTALLLCNKCRILMAESNAEHKLDSMFYEADTAFIGSKSKKEHSQGNGTEKQLFLALLSTVEDNNYPRYVKLYMIPFDNGAVMKSLISRSAVLSKDRVLNTDGKTTFNTLSDKITLKSEKILYGEDNHRLKWLNRIIGNTKNQILGIYHGVAKRSLQLFLQEQEYRFNHRNIGKNVLNKVQKYLTYSTPHPHRSIKLSLDIAERLFTQTCG